MIAVNKIAASMEAFIKTGAAKAIIIINGSKRMPNILFIKKIIKIYVLVASLKPVTQPVNFKETNLKK